MCARGGLSFRPNMADSAWSLPLRIRWDEELSLVSGDGALPGCPVPAPGMPLTEALGGDPATDPALGARARTGAAVEYVRTVPPSGGAPRWLRVGMEPTGQGVEAGGYAPGAPPGGGPTP